MGCTARFSGYAFGLNGGVPIGSIEGLYLWLGSSF